MFSTVVIALNNAISHGCKTRGMDQIETFTRAVDQTGRIVAAVKPDQLGDSTPCAEWDVRALLNHTISAVSMFDDAAQEKEFDGSRFSKDQVGTDPADN